MATPATEETAAADPPATAATRPTLTRPAVAIRNGTGTRRCESTRTSPIGSSPNPTNLPSPHMTEQPARHLHRNVVVASNTVGRLGSVKSRLHRAFQGGSRSENSLRDRFCDRVRLNMIPPGIRSLPFLRCAFGSATYGHRIRHQFHTAEIIWETLDSRTLMAVNQLQFNVATSGKFSTGCNYPRGAVACAQRIFSVARFGNAIQIQRLHPNATPTRAVP